MPVPRSRSRADRPASAATIALAGLLLAGVPSALPIGAERFPEKTTPTVEPGRARGEATELARVHPLVLLELDDTRLRFSALGRDWDVALEPRALLSAAARAELGDAALPRFLGGRVIGDEGSWVRLARSGARLSGHLSSDGRLYRIEPPSGGDGYRLVLVGDVSAEGGGANGWLPRTRGGEPLVSRAMRVGIVVDSRYDERSDGRGLERALGIMNGVDGLYREQLGLAVLLERVRVHDDPETDPMRLRGGTVEQVLGSFREVRRSDPGLPDGLALVHLFSGHEDPNGVIGLGWIDTACRLDGYDVSMSTPFPYDTLLSAHEIAHNLGALHDEDPRCEAPDEGAGTSRLMEERLSGTTVGEFSACSLERLSRTLGASCLVDSLDLALDVSAAPATDARERRVAVSVVNEDPWRTARAVRTRTRFPAGTALAEASAGCTLDGALLLCEHGDVAPEATTAVSVLATLDPDGAGENGGELVATIAPAGDRVDSRSANDRVTLELFPPAAPGARPARAANAGTTPGAAQGAPQGTTQDAAREVAREAAPGAIDGAGREAAEGATPSATPSAMPEAARDVARETGTDAPRDETAREAGPDPAAQGTSDGPATGIGASTMADGTAGGTDGGDANGGGPDETDRGDTGGDIGDDDPDGPGGGDGALGGGGGGALGLAGLVSLGLAGLARRRPSRRGPSRSPGRGPSRPASGAGRAQRSRSTE